MGTPAYMSPEQARGEVETLDARSDIYALGAILFHLLHRRAPYSGRSAMETVEKVARGDIEWKPAKKEVPESLLAVVRQAMAFDRDLRYWTVAELQADLTAYQAGFATSAENAGLAKQVILLVKRHQGVAATAFAAWLIITALAGWFVVKVTNERNRAERALTDLRHAAPTLAAQAETLVRDQRIDEAIGKLDFAITIDPGNPAYLLQRAQLLQASLNLREAAAAFRKVLSIRPGEPSARTNLVLCERLLAQTGTGDELPQEAKRALYDALRAEGRNAESVPLAQALGLGTEATSKAISAAVANWKNLPEWPRTKVRGYRTSDGTYTLDLNNLPIQDLSPLASLRGLPVTSLYLTKTLVSDLSPVSGLPLRTLNLSLSPVKDFAPLKGMALTRLIADNTKISSLEPLRGMPLRELNINSCKEITDLEPLRGMPLEQLSMSYCQAIKSWEPLRGMRLRYLYANDIRTTAPNLDVLRGMPLETLAVGVSKKAVRSLEALRGMPLKVLKLHDTDCSDLGPLAGMPLRSITLHWCKNLQDATILGSILTLEEVTLPRNVDPTPLRKLPALQRLSYRFIYDQSTPAQTAAEFWAEYDAQQAAGKK